MDSADVTPFRRARSLQPLSDQRLRQADRLRPGSMREKLGARWHKSRLRRSASKTRATDGSAKVRLRDGDVEAFRHLAHSVVSRTLALECEFRRQGCPEPGMHEWKLLKRHIVPVCTVQNAAGVPAVTEPGQRTCEAPTAFCVGTIDGSLEDVLYGLHAKTRREMHVTNAFLNKGHVECAVLSVTSAGQIVTPSNS
ncbi:uncharacterized protein KRP23_12668 [Phytophthora ramorum]|uniref:uncharacterized protein n=1 Tax=Phytophthora ramorum TaxID=164328 RepID=UPI003096230D|nr:hypothetical protein KRP23_12668 [Phytophthora ramorum]